MKFSDHERAVRHMMRAPKTRRDMLKQLGAGMGTIGLAGLMADKGLLAPAAQASTSPLAPKTPHFALGAPSVQVSRPRLEREGT